MTCNALLTMAVMSRCNERPADPAHSNILGEFIDRNYNDDFVGKRWRKGNMWSKSLDFAGGIR